MAERCITYYHTWERNVGSRDEGGTRETGNISVVDDIPNGVQEENDDHSVLLGYAAGVQGLVDLRNNGINVSFLTNPGTYLLSGSQQKRLTGRGGPNVAPELPVLQNSRKAKDQYSLSLSK
ncbi:uncharacterized protein ARMOST_06367 [Armillaria ostoyae]|uniref:Uncharacterized protein n=1 Tax=Armillaria ostoyae TaxID=47428 RepID=A0A284R2V4_ARMOS|nr:uncharacterized protein ARMOST_06367 [Armillaria ostoyae]